MSNKKLSVLMIILVFSVSSAVLSAGCGRKKSEPKPASGSNGSASGGASGEHGTPMPPKEPPTPAALLQKRSMEALNGTRWDIELKPMSGESSGDGVKDVLSFDGGQLSSKRLAKGGYPTTNLTFTIKDNGVTVWETMQTAQDSSVVFWQGELHGDKMRGVLSEHPKQGAVQNWAFSGQLSGGASPPESANPEAKQ